MKKKLEDVPDISRVFSLGDGGDQNGAETGRNEVCWL